MSGPKVKKERDVAIKKMCFFKGYIDDPRKMIEDGLAEYEEQLEEEDDYEDEDL